MIQRLLQKEVLETLKSFPAVCLLGPRQVGKSTFAHAIVAKYKKECIFLDLEKRSDKEKLSDPELFLSAHKDHLVVIDEVQFMPELFTVLRPIIDEYRKPGRFLLLGSAAPELVKGVSESLAGRIAYMELPPVNFIEAAKHKVSQDDLWLKGGFPAALTYKSMKISMQWRQQLVRSFVERDLSALFGIDISQALVRNFWQMLAHQQGGLWNANMFANSLGVTGPTVKRYMQFMQGAYLVRALEPWYVNVNKRLVKSPKVYVRDSGLLHSMLDIDSLNALMGHPVVGGSWEGFVIEQIIQQLPHNVRPFFYRTHQGAEADLVLVRGIKPLIAIEIKLTNAPVISKGFYQSLEDLKLENGYLITPNVDTYPQKNITVTGLLYFIKNILPTIFK